MVQRRLNTVKPYSSVRDTPSLSGHLIPKENHQKNRFSLSQKERVRVINAGIGCIYSRGLTFHSWGAADPIFAAIRSALLLP